MSTAAASRDTKRARTGATKEDAGKTQEASLKGKAESGVAAPAVGTAGTTGISVPISHYPTNSEFIHMLTRTRADSLPIADGKIFICQRTDKVIDVWKGLIQHNFLSVPVLQKTGSKYYGFVDLGDIVKYVVQNFGEAKLKEMGSTSFWDLVGQEDYFKERTINDIMTYPLSLRNPFHPVPRGYSLFHVCELLAREKGLHRVPVVDENRKLVHMVTQSRIIDMLMKNVELLGEIRNKPVSLIRSLEHQLITVKETDIALSAFHLMTEKNISGLPVINEEGKLSGSLSLVDLKAIQHDAHMFWRLFETVKNFIQKLKIGPHETMETDRPRTMVSVKSDDTLDTVLKRLSEHKIHRIFVVDDEKKPIGCISLKDLLFEIISA